MAVTVRKTRAFTVRRPEFEARILLDHRNERIKVSRYRYQGVVAPLADFLVETAREHGVGMIVVPALEADWQDFLTRGFALEGRVDTFFRGAPAHFMAYFLNGERQNSDRHEEKQRLLQAILEQPREPAGDLPEGYELVVAGVEMAGELAAVYDRVFETYPSPLTDPEYVRELIESGEGVFMAVLSDGQIASAAAAEVDREWRNAEMTNCATLPDFRGEGLMQVLIAALEQEMEQQSIPCLYSMARALSFGMNRVLHRLGYTFRGRLVNHAHIGGGFEDLNLWERA
jgi:beta-lysine N6-acetyltransferase